MVGVGVWREPPPVVESLAVGVAEGLGSETTRCVGAAVMDGVGIGVWLKPPLLLVFVFAEALADGVGRDDGLAVMVAD
jgi:hypothetical protein